MLESAAREVEQAKTAESKLEIELDELKYQMTKLKENKELTKANKQIEQL